MAGTARSAQAVCGKRALKMACASWRFRGGERYHRARENDGDHREIEAAAGAGRRGGESNGAGGARSYEPIWRRRLTVIIEINVKLRNELRRKLLARY